MKQKNKKQSKNYNWFFIVSVLALAISIGIMIYVKKIEVSNSISPTPKTQSTQNILNKPIVYTSPTPSITPTITLPPITPIHNGNTYTDNTFSITYPNDWILNNRDNDTPFLRRLREETHIITLEKEGYILLATIYPASDKRVHGGIFLDAEEIDTFKKEHNLIVIQNKPYYLSNKHTSLEIFEGEYEYVDVVQLTKFPDLEQESIYKNNIWSKIITNKNGYSYEISKYSRKPITDIFTPDNIQQEMLSILSTIKW